MAHGALSRRVEGIGEGSVVGTLSKLLQLSCEAVLVFDGSGRILLANEEAAELFCAPGGLVGGDVRLLFPSAEGDEPLGPFSAERLPFPVDGTSARAVCLAASGRPVTVRVRCDTVRAPGETYLLLALPLEADEVADRETERMLEDLRRANHRLSGTLNIVLDTIDADDLQALFGRVLEEITDTMEADGTLVYLSESDGFRLRGVSSSLLDDRPARFMPFGRSIERVAVRDGRTVRLRLSAPSNEALRRGRLAVREVVSEETHEVLKVKSALLPPFASFMAVPVWFGGHVISIIEVGWRRLHPLPKDDAKLLDSVAHYLSVQLASAFTALRSQRADHLASVSTELREELLDSATEGAGEGFVHRLSEVLRSVADELEAAAVPVREGATRGLVSAVLPLNGPRELPVDLDAVTGPHRREEVAVVPIPPESELSALLRDLGEPCVGALVDMGEIAGGRYGALLHRPDGAEPLDDLETEFLFDLAADVRDIARGEEAREQDKRIAQALQMGMRNELQEVEGVTAEAVYSSATAAVSAISASVREAFRK